MKPNPFKEEHHLRTKLDEYEIDVPNFPMKSKYSNWERLIHMLASPTKDPLEPLLSTTNGFMFMKIVPIAGTVVLTLIQIFLLN